MARQKRPVSEYIEAAKKLAKFAPSLKKYKRRKTLTRYEKSAIAHKEKLLRFADHLIPVSKKTAKELKGQLFGPGIRAIQLRNTGKDVRIKKIRKGLFMAESNGRPWIYWSLPNKSPQSLQRAGREAFLEPDTFDIEKIIALAQQAFEQPETKAVFLWAESGRVGEGNRDLKQFVQWIHESYSKYQNTDIWVRGIAILIGDVNEHISASEFASFGTTPQERFDRRIRRARR